MLWPGGAQLRGVVLDATGGPVAAASVRAFYPIDAASGAAQTAPQAGGAITALTDAIATDDDGRFELWVPQGRLGLRAEAQGYASSHVTRIAPDPNVEIVLSPAGTIRGRVVSARDGKPISGATVRADSGSPSPFDVASSISDEAGMFSIASLPAGVYRVRAAGDYWRGSHPGSVVLGISESVDDVVVAVDHATVVSARVVSRPSEAPCASGRARISTGPSIMPLEGPIAAGAVRIAGVPPGRYGGFVQCDGHVVIAIPPFEVDDDEVSDLVWTVDAGETLGVRVLDERRAAVAGDTLMVELIGTSPDASSQQACVTDATGLCKLTGLRAGSYRITSTASRRTVETRAPADEEVVLIVPVMGAIEVSVRSALGEPIDNLAVYAQTEGMPDVVAQPAGEGTYRLAPISAGTYRVFATDGLNPSAEANAAVGGVTVSSGETERVTLERPAYAGTLRGRVSDGQGNALADVWVEAWSAQTHESYASVQRYRRRSEGLRTLTDRQGRFAIEGIDESATFRVKVEHGLGGSLVVDGITAAREAEIVLQPMGKLAGSARDEAGEPVASFRLQVTNTAADQRRMQTIADEAGRWLADAIAPGEVQIDAIDALGRAARQAVRLEPGQELSSVTLIFTTASTP